MWFVGVHPVLTAVTVVVLRRVCPRQAVAMLVSGGSYAAPTAGGSGSGGPLDDVAAGRAAIVLHNGRLLLTPLPPALDNAADTAVATTGFAVQ